MKRMMRNLFEVKILKFIYKVLMKWMQGVRNRSQSKVSRECPSQCSEPPRSNWRLYCMKANPAHTYNHTDHDTSPTIDDLFNLP